MKPGEWMIVSFLMVVLGFLTGMILTRLVR